SRHGTRLRGWAGGLACARGRADRGPGPRWTLMALGARYGNLRHVAAAAENLPRASASSNDDGWTLGTRRDSSANWTNPGSEVAQRFGAWRQKDWRHLDGNVRGAVSGAIRDRRNRNQR